MQRVPPAETLRQGTTSGFTVQHPNQKISLRGELEGFLRAVLGSLVDAAKRQRLPRMIESLERSDLARRHRSSLQAQGASGRIGQPGGVTRFRRHEKALG